MPHRAPQATYRLQFNSNFRFRDAIPILDYLRDLGISSVYASPILASRSGSGHGYDVIDPTHIDPDAGGEDGFAALQSALEERGMGLLLDIVPNHMAASRENRWWMDVLEYGPDSPYASYFDIDWKPASRSLENKLLLPFLARPFGEVLNDGELRLHCQEGRFVLEYGEQLFPIAPSSYAEILSASDGEPHNLPPPDSPAAQEWQGILAVAQALAASNGGSHIAAAERRTKFEQMRDRLRQLVVASPEISAFVETTLQTLNGIPGNAHSFCKLEHLLSGQHYRLAFWQSVSDAINYRRFFSITDLVGVRVEDPPVFDATHELLIRIALRSGCAGFRIDHIDGLRDPLGYLKRLRERLSVQNSCGVRYLVVEKILEGNESLPEDWPVQGTTGYDYMNFVNRLLMDEKNAQAIEDVYSRWIGIRQNFDDVLYDQKKLVMRTLLGVEMRALGRALAELARDDRYARELHPAELGEALIEVTACLSVYRTYIQTLDVSDVARNQLTRAIESARIRRPTLAPEYFNFLADVLLLGAPEHVRADQREARMAFVTRWQQFTGSIMAKGLEDTALYTYFPLASLNEVGSDPRPAGIDPLAFHQFIAARREKWPDSMNATTTHDTKRSEDVRARIAVLSEMPERWEASLQRWSRMNERHTSKLDGAAVPDRNEEYLFYQTLIGMWPLRKEQWPAIVPRIQDYMIKASREAKIHTNWARPDQPHETALREFIAGTMDRQQNSEFCSSFDQFQKCTAFYGMLNGLSQTLLKTTSPGIPDFYQGSELWDLRLVDPDNRGPVDFEERRAKNAALRESYQSAGAHGIEALLTSWRDARVKLHVLTQALQTRTANPDLFQNGDYQPLESHGAYSDRMVAFARQYQEAWAIAIVPRRAASVHAPVLRADDRKKFWTETHLALPNSAPGKWINILAGQNAPPILCAAQRLSLGDAFEGFPLALLLPAS